MQRLRQIENMRRLQAPLVIYLASAMVYVAVTGPLALQTSGANHYAHLANSWLHGQLHVVGNRPVGYNDWACIDTHTDARCPHLRFQFPGDTENRYRWYVSFPPLPAVVMLPWVALWGPDVPDRLIWALVGGLGPALLWVLLRSLSERGYSSRRSRENLLLTGLFAFGTVYFFAASPANDQGTVWYAAHIVAVPLTALFALWSIGARRPAWAGLALGLAFLTRPTTLFLGVLFVVEAMRASRGRNGRLEDESKWLGLRVLHWLRDVRWAECLRKLAWFASPVAILGGVAAVHNEIRFGDPVEFGHNYLQVYWQPKIQKWGLFNYHYVARNLAVMVASLPWLSSVPPYLLISRHGLALWVTTPNLLWILWPKRVNVLHVGLWGAVLSVALLDLFYQNSGWVQFGYRFSLDYMVLLFVLLAIGGRKFGVGFWTLAVVAVAINTFGALTFGRSPQFYGGGGQQVIFQPD